MEISASFKKTEVGIIPSNWKVSTLDELTALMTNGFVGTATTYYTDSEDGVLYIQGYNVEENTFNFNGIKRVTLDFHKKHLKSCLQADDLLTVQTGDVGLTTIVPDELIGSNCHALIISRFKKIKYDPKFFSHYLNSFQGRSRLKEIEIGSTMKHINVGDLKLFVVPEPPIEEQTAIANALSDADALIGSLQKLIAKKRQIKQGAMQSLLDPYENGVLKAGWIESKLSNVLKIGHGRSQHEVTCLNGEYPILASGGEIGRANKFLYDKPSVLIGRKGTIDVPQFMDKPFWTIDTLFYTEIFEPHNAKYFFYQFNLIDWYSYNEASGVPSLSSRTIENIEVGLPNPDEQTRIATILSDMDTEISALETKLAKYQQIKQGMMQNLLTGRIRLI